MNKPKIFYIHGGGDTIGGIETHLASSFKYHRLYEPYLGVVRYGKFFDYIKDTGFDKLIDLEGGRLREANKTFKAIYNAVTFIRNNKIRLIIAKGTHSWVFGGIVAKLSGIKSILYMAGDIRKENFRNPIDGIALRMKPTIYVANSEFTAKTVRQFLREDVIVTYPSSDVKQFDSIDELEARGKLREEFNISENKFIFSIVGRVQRWKGQDTAILALRNMRHKERVCLIIVGDCTFKSDELFYSYLRELAENEGSIIFTGFRKDIPLIMKGSDAIIHASRNPEPFGIVIVEGMMAKKPVIATAHGGPLEIIKSGKDGFLFEPEDHYGLSKIMDTLVENNYLCRKLSEAAYNKAKAKFTMEVSMNRLENIISDIAGIN